MLKPLRSERRRTLLRSSFCALAGAMLIAPLALPPALPAQAGDDPPSTAASAIDLGPPAEPKIRIARDPFVPEVAAGSTDGGVQSSGGVVVEAVALGSSPRALVQTGSTSRIVGAGDALAGSKITSIDARGITLDSGDVLMLAVPR
jgi:hypothetical protein